MDWNKDLKSLVKGISQLKAPDNNYVYIVLHFIDQEDLLLGSNSLLEFGVKLKDQIHCVKMVNDNINMFEILEF